MTHAQILSEVLSIAKEKKACASEYRRAAQSTDMASLAAVLRDNFHWCCDNWLLTADTITRWGLREYGITCNEDVSSGYCLATGSATVKASDRATVTAYDRATVEAFGSATVKASDRATVTAFGSATVEAYDRATVRAYGSATVKASDRATVTAFGSATVEASDRATVRAFGSATVKAFGSAYIHAPYNTIECKLNDSAILRHCNTITAANGQTLTL